MLKQLESKESEEWQDPFADLPPPLKISDDVPVVGWILGALGFAFFLIDPHKLRLF